MSIVGATVQLRTWTQVKQEQGYTDNNDGYEYGIEFINNELDPQWFTSESDMYTFINDNSLKVQKELLQS